MGMALFCAIIWGMSVSVRPVGDLLREWRQRRRLSQLDLALDANVSTRHLSFVETGRAQPSRDMVLHLAEQLEIPLRERNALLTAAGYAPAFPERPLADPALSAARKAIEVILTGHEPYPAHAIDRHWNIVASNRMVAPLLTGVDDALRTPPVNVLRLSLHPAGLAPRIANYRQWRAHLMMRLRQQVESSADPVLAELLKEMQGYPMLDGVGTAKGARTTAEEYAGVVVPIQLVTEAGALAFFSTTTVFGTPVDVTLSEIALETFFPADAATAAVLHGLMAKQELSTNSTG
jgi:transcriptional regulator with XRE-family HTH domain